MTERNQTTNWRQALTTPEAHQALRALRRFGADAPPAERAEALRWFAETGVSAIQEAHAEACRRGISIYDPAF